MRRRSDDEWRAALSGARSSGEVLRRLGLASSGSNYSTLRNKMRQFDVELPKSMSRERLNRAAAGSRSMAEMLRRLGLVPRGGNYSTLRRKLAEFEVDTSHFTGMGWRRGTTEPVVKKHPLHEVLLEGRYVSSHGLKLRLIKEGRKEARCEHCKLASWQGRPISLELDHVNGRNDDNRLSNLRLLCPNCHASTPTYRGRNKRSNLYSPPYPNRQRSTP